MNPIAVILVEAAPECSNPVLRSSLQENPLIETVITLSPEPGADTHLTIGDPWPHGGRCLERALRLAGECPFIMVIDRPQGLVVSVDDTARLLAAAHRGDRALTYADYYEGSPPDVLLRTVMDYQIGSVRDDFPLGPVLLFSGAHVRSALRAAGGLSHTRWAGLYELRLAVSLSGSVQRLPEPVGRVTAAGDAAAHFAYVDAAGREYQLEMEQVVTGHLTRLGACCTHLLKPAPEDTGAYPVEASVVIPVKNRARTIAEAIQSALEQEADFAFNVLVVQNHSTDATPRIINALAEKDSRVAHLVPRRRDLGIGGCWNEALLSPLCGRFVCQLDSDDLYSDSQSLATMLAPLRAGHCGMVVGSYRVVNFQLEDLPPGIVDHREWSDANGRNNLLRVNGIGAPRAFAACLLRRHPFPNVSYGEDYAVALRISRDYRVGRIYTPVYLCRRWEDNTDAQLTREQAHAYAHYKDSLRTTEILERQKRHHGADAPA
jgi:hypothetical protein